MLAAYVGTLGLVNPRTRNLIVSGSLLVLIILVVAGGLLQLA
ncbi:MAG: hypothetical protein ACK5LS_05030 [Propioniciclava sp.]